MIHPDPQSQDLGQSALGAQLSHSELQATLDLMEPGFARADFESALGAVAQAQVSPRIAHRVLQNLRRKGVIRFDRDAQLWRKLAQPGAQGADSLGMTFAQAKTLPLLSINARSHDRYPPGKAVRESRDAGRLTNMARVALSSFACFSLIAALISLNASFAWELGGEAPQFRAAFVAALMALDLMRPFLVGAGFWLAGQSKWFTAILAITIALALSPVSILSSTSILSASILLGAEMNSDADTRAATRQALRAEHGRLLEQAVSEEQVWQAECRRGGCGPVAGGLKLQFEATLAKAQKVLDQIVALTNADDGNSALLARMVMTFRGVGVFGADRQILLPLLLAISLELGALFGPALLLRRRL